MTFLIRFFLLLLLGQCALAQSSLPLKAGNVLVGRIDIDSRKKVTLPEGRWVVMGLHTNEIPLTGGTKTSQTVNNVSLMNDDENAPFQYLSVRWTAFSDTNWTDQPCDSNDSVKSRPKKDTFNTNTSSVTVKCSAASYNTKFGNLNFPQNYNKEGSAAKNLWLPVAQHSRSKPITAVEVYGFLSKNRNDFINWHGYINPYFFGLDQLSDTQYSTPTNSRQIIADKLLEYTMNWNKQYMEQVEKEFFPTLFLSASRSVDRFHFKERVENIPQPTVASTQPNISPSNLHACQGDDVTTWNDCFGTRIHSNNDKYVGEWRSGRYHGKGTFSFADGSKFVGEFKNGMTLATTALERSSLTNQTAPLVTIKPDNSERDRLLAEVEAERKKRQELEEQLRVAQQPNKQPVNLGIERRVALVIGNSTYRVSPLDNPANDATDITNALNRVGFKTTLIRNATLGQMRDATRKFAEQLQSADVALIYFAGHGIESNRKNYMIPVNADLKFEYELTDQAYDAGSWLEMLETIKSSNTERVNIVILDACRNNNLIGSRSLGRGLGRMDAPTGTFLSYSTAPGKVAADGTKGQRNSPFTRHLLSVIQQPGLQIEEAFKEVRRNVSRETNGAQVPWESTSLVGKFFFTAQR